MCFKVLLCVYDVQGLEDLCGHCDSLPLIAVVFRDSNPRLTSSPSLPSCQSTQERWWWWRDGGAGGGGRLSAPGPSAGRARHLLVESQIHTASLSDRNLLSSRSNFLFFVCVCELTSWFRPTTVSHVTASKVADRQQARGAKQRFELVDLQLFSLVFWEFES